MRLMVFSKHLAELPLGVVAQRLRQMGISEIDLTVRPGGHVEPERAEDDLPRAAHELGEHGVKIGMITTAIKDAAEPTTQRVLATAAKLGIGYYKLGYWYYSGFGTLHSTRNEVRAKCRELAILNATLGIVGGFHNHSDIFIGASLADIDYVLQDAAPGVLGLYLDPCHAVIEGGSAGWKMGLDLLRERVVMLAVKDFRWVEAGQGYAGGRRHSVQFCPLENGNVPWPEVLGCLRQIGFNGPVSFHSEYQGAHSFRDLTSEDVLQQTSRDIERFREWNNEVINLHKVSPTN